MTTTPETFAAFRFGDALDSPRTTELTSQQTNNNNINININNSTLSNNDEGGDADASGWSESSVRFLSRKSIANFLQQDKIVEGEALFPGSPRASIVANASADEAAAASAIAQTKDPRKRVNILLAMLRNKSHLLAVVLSREEKASAKNRAAVSSMRQQITALEDSIFALNSENSTLKSRLTEGTQISLRQCKEDAEKAMREQLEKKEAHIDQLIADLVAERDKCEALNARLLEHTTTVQLMETENKMLKRRTEVEALRESEWFQNALRSVQAHVHDLRRCFVETHAEVTNIVTHQKSWAELMLFKYSVSEEISRRKSIGILHESDNEDGGDDDNDIIALHRQAEVTQSEKSSNNSKSSTPRNATIVGKSSRSDSPSSAISILNVKTTPERASSPTRKRQSAVKKSPAASSLKPRASVAAPGSPRVVGFAPTSTRRSSVSSTSSTPRSRHNSYESSVANLSKALFQSTFSLAPIPDVRRKLIHACVQTELVVAASGSIDTATQTYYDDVDAVEYVPPKTESEYHHPLLVAGTPAASAAVSLMASLRAPRHNSIGIQTSSSTSSTFTKPATLQQSLLMDGDCGDDATKTVIGPSPIIARPASQQQLHRRSGTPMKSPNRPLSTTPVSIKHDILKKQHPVLAVLGASGSSQNNNQNQQQQSNNNNNNTTSKTWGGILLSPSSPSEHHSPAATTKSTSSFASRKQLPTPKRLNSAASTTPPQTRQHFSSSIVKQLNLSAGTLSQTSTPPNRPPTASGIVADPDLEYSPASTATPAPNNSTINNESEKELDIVGHSNIMKVTQPRVYVLARASERAADVILRHTPVTTQAEYDMSLTAQRDARQRRSAAAKSKKCSREVQTTPLPDVMAHGEYFATVVYAIHAGLEACLGPRQLFARSKPPTSVSMFVDLLQEHNERLRAFLTTAAPIMKHAPPNVFAATRPSSCGAPPLALPPPRATAGQDPARRQSSSVGKVGTSTNGGLPQPIILSVKSSADPRVAESVGRPYSASVPFLS
eukprot:PhM_4_TR9311/c0_g1_i1/m.81420